MEQQLVGYWVSFLYALFGVFCWAATLYALSGLLLLTFNLLRRVLLRIFEVAAIVEAAREAKAQGRAPMLRAWTRLDALWRARNEP